MAFENIRRPTEEELRDFQPILLPGVENPKTGEDKFRGLLAEKRLEANKKGLPFAFAVAIDEWKSYYKDQVAQQVREFGFVKNEIKPLQLDWNKYSDLKNFDLVQEDERIDDQLSKRMNKQITLKTKVYKFKGYFHTYTVQEDPVKAIERIERENAERLTKK